MENYPKVESNKIIIKISRVKLGVRERNTSSKVRNWINFSGFFLCENILVNSMYFKLYEL